VDHPLTDKGRLQAQQTAILFENIAIDRIYSSPLIRAKETAAILSQTIKLSVTVIEDFREVNVGSLEDMPPDEAAWSIYRETMRQWLSGNSDARFPGGESRQELLGRFRSGLNQARADGGQSILVVGHGGSFTHGVADLCGIQDLKSFFSRDSQNCSVSELVIGNNSDLAPAELIRWGDTTHLSGPAAQLVEGIPEFAKVRNL
jgi:broad specificity phosphatase PhoE